MNNRKLLFAILLVLYLSHQSLDVDTPLPPTPEPEKVYTVKDSEEFLSADNFSKHVYALSSFDGRKPNTNGYDLAKQYVKQELNGLVETVQEVPNRDENVMYFIPGIKEEIIVLGAHLDHLGSGYPGADDNASGCSAVIELAKLCSLINNDGKSPPPNSLLFQFYTAEESGLIGSAYYCKNPTYPLQNPDIKKHIYMINFDMIGHKRQSESYEYTKDFERSQKMQLLRVFDGFGGSDHASFQRVGIETKFYFTGLTSTYHKPTDKPDTLDYDGIEEIAEEAFDFLVEYMDGEEVWAN